MKTWYVECFVNGDECVISGTHSAENMADAIAIFLANVLESKSDYDRRGMMVQAHEWDRFEIREVKP